MSLERFPLGFAFRCDAVLHILHEWIEVVADEKCSPQGGSLRGPDPSVELDSVRLRVGEGGVADELAVAPRDRALQASRLLVQELFTGEAGAKVWCHGSRRGCQYNIQLPRCELFDRMLASRDLRHRLGQQERLGGRVSLHDARRYEHRWVNAELDRDAAVSDAVQE